MANNDPMATFRAGLAGLLLVGGALLAGGCSTLAKSVEAPKVSLAQVSIVEAGLLEQRYRLTLRVQNPNAIPVPIKGLSYAVRFGGDDFASGVTPSAFSLPANGENLVDIDVSTNLLRSAQHLMKVLEGKPDSLEYELSGKVDVDLPFVKPIPFSRAGAVPLTRASR